MEGCHASSEWDTIYVHALYIHPFDNSIIEGTQESLARLQLDYVDIIFAHRPDKTGTDLSFAYTIKG